MADATREPDVRSGRHPRPVAMVVCERLLSDAVTDQLSLLALVSDVEASDFPVTVSWAVYARVTDAEGTYLVLIDVVRRDDLREVVRTTIARFETTDPLDDGEILVPRIEIPIPSPGSYDVRLWFNDRFVHSVSFRVRDRIS